MTRFFCFMLVSLSTAVAAQPQLAAPQVLLDCHLVPGWEQSASVRQFTPDNLYDYKDGAAEGYLQFGFTRMQTIECKSGGHTLAIDISEMAGPELAYGMFSANRDPAAPTAKIGAAAQLQSQSALFTRGSYFVELTIIDAPPEADFTPALHAFAEKINQRLTGSDSPPAILDVFPREGLTEAPRLIPESVLGLRLIPRGYVAKYAQGQAFIVEEDTPQSAAALMQKLRAYFAKSTPTNIGDEAFQAKVQYLDGLCIFRKGRYLAGFANLPDPAQAAVDAAKLLPHLPPDHTLSH